MYYMSIIINKKNLLLIFLMISNLCFGITPYNFDYYHKKYMKDQILTSINTVDQAISDIVNLPNLQRKRLAVVITLASKEYNLDPRIILSILYVESRFKQQALSNTGDFSIAQINYKVWEKSFKKINKKSLNFKQLKEDETYAIYRMAEILNFLQSTYSKNDPYWFALYHSSTLKYKNRYIGLLKKPMEKLKKYGSNMVKNIPNDPNQVVSIYFNE